MAKPRQRKSGNRPGKRRPRSGPNGKGRVLTLELLHADLQTLAQVCQMNFQQMSQNDKVLIDMTTTNGIHVRAMMEALKDHEIELQPYIDAELERRQKELEEMRSKEEAVKKQVQEALEKASDVVQPAEVQDGDHEPPPDPPPADDDDAPLVFGAQPEEEATDVIGKDR